MMPGIIQQIQLNKEQADAVHYNDGSQLVFAGAGTGKTRVLTAKIAWLIAEKNIRPYNIFAATFTNKAAREMKERVAALIDMSCDSLWIGTFHSLCVRILRAEGHVLGYSRWFSIYDGPDQKALIKSIIKKSGIDEKAMRPKMVLHAISSYKNRCITTDILEKKAESFYEKELLDLYKEYQEGLKKADAMDFDDLILNTVLLLKNNADILVRYHDVFRYILVDEYQDTNGAQFTLIKTLAGEVSPVFAVGDDDQSIYGWRGAQIENILGFDRAFGNTKTFFLERNYRSTKNILRFANSLISKNENRNKKTLWTASDAGDEIVLRRYSNDLKEAECTVHSIADSLEKNTAALSEIAVFFRTNSQTRQFERELLKADIPYTIVGGTAFYSRKEIKDIIAYLRLLTNPRDTLCCQRIINIPARGIGSKSQEKIARSARDAGVSFFEHICSGEAEKVLSGKGKKGVKQFRRIYEKLIALHNGNAGAEELTHELLLQTGYLDDLRGAGEEEAEQRIENINEFVNAVAQWQEENPEGILEHFLEEITLATDVDSVDRENSVKLMTLHASKGLEFDEVYIAGVEQGLLPSMQSLNDPEKIEEERRLLYVGATRARNRLTCSFCESRMRFGSVMPMGISPFLETVDAELYRFVEESARYNRVYWSDTGNSSAYRSHRNSLKKSSKGALKRGAPVLMKGSDLLQKNKKTTTEAIPLSTFGQPGKGASEFRQGQTVTHEKFGAGKILNVSGLGSNTRVTVLFEGGERKKLVAKYAKLTIVHN
jgi:DNA helicase-2/ATP-dependent DNA helicase PcrA